MTVVAERPDDVEALLRSEWPELERHAREALAVEAYRQRKISVRTVARLLSLDDIWAAARFLGDRGIYPNYDADDLAEDEAKMQRLSRGRAA